MPRPTGWLVKPHYQSKSGQEMSHRLAVSSQHATAVIRKTLRGQIDRQTEGGRIGGRESDGKRKAKIG